MKRGITALALEPIDLLTSIEVAEEAGYEAIELRTYLIDSFLSQNHTVADIRAALDASTVDCNLMGAILDIELPEGPARNELEEYFRKMCEISQQIGCLGIQVVSGRHFARSSWETVRKQTAKGLRSLAEIATDYDMKVVLEPLAWMPVCNTARALEVIEEAYNPNISILVDSFQIFAGGDDLDTISNLDPNIMATVHLGDCAAKKIDVWSDEDRYTMAGDGIVPLKQFMKAIVETGYDGVISDEVWPARYTDWSRIRLAKSIKMKADAVIRLT